MFELVKGRVAWADYFPTNLTPGHPISSNGISFYPNLFPFAISFRLMLMPQWQWAGVCRNLSLMLTWNNFICQNDLSYQHMSGATFEWRTNIIIFHNKTSHQWHPITTATLPSGKFCVAYNTCIVRDFPSHGISSTG